MSDGLLVMTDDAGIEWLPAWRQPQRSLAPVPILWRDGAGRAGVQFGVNLRKNLEAVYAAGGGMDAEGVSALDALDEAANRYLNILQKLMDFVYYPLKTTMDFVLK